MTIFLRDRKIIGQALRERAGRRLRLAFAVAYLSTEWKRVLHDFRGTGRVVCWLSSGATNPWAVEDLMAFRGGSIEVKQLDGMHAKVYLFPGPRGFAIVGSANLSRPALGDDHAGNVEAAVLIDEPQALEPLGQWFEELWSRARPIYTADVRKAKLAYRVRQRQQSGRAKVALGKAVRVMAAISESSGKWPLLKRLASKVRRLDLDQEFGSYLRFEPATMDRTDTKEVYERLVDWTGRPGIHAPLLQVPSARLREVFTTAFDESMSIEERLVLLDGPLKLPGIALPSWTMILQHRLPERYPPFNGPTRKFIVQMRLTVKAGKAPTLTPRNYVAWLSICDQLAERLDLPSPGHVDRMVYMFEQDEKRRKANEQA